MQQSEANKVARLYDHKFFYEDPRVEILCKQKGVIKKKKEKSLIVGKNPGSFKKFFRFHKKGRFLAYYDDCPPKADSKPRLLAHVQEIRDLQAAPNKKSDHFKLVLPDEEMELKCDDLAEKDSWLRTIAFFREFYAQEKTPRLRSYKDELDLETLTEIMAENELDNWDSARAKHDYSQFVRDKGFQELFNLYPLPMLSNRVLLSAVKKQTKWHKDNLGAGNAQNVNTSTRGSQVMLGNSMLSQPPPGTPQTPGKGLLGRLDKWDTFGSKSYMALLVSQRPISDVDEEHGLRDVKAIGRGGMPADYEFNTVYLFVYGGAGDAKRFHKAIPAR